MAAMSEEEKSRHDSEYQSMVALFISLLRSVHSDGKTDALYSMAELRTDITLNRVIKGLGIDYNKAIILLQNTEDENITQQDKDMRARLEAALNNLIEFSVCEEYQLYEEVLDAIGDDEIEFDSDEYDELLALCKKYNDQYAVIENADIEYAGVMAALWMKMSASDYAVYWTQNDAKVRPWHMALQGYAAPRDEFPSWMIPPIEYNCRCFLEILEVPHAEAALSRIKGSAKSIEKPKQLCGVFDESLAKCGRIFGPAHSYFSVKESDKEMLSSFVAKLKAKYQNG